MLYAPRVAIGPRRTVLCLQHAVPARTFEAAAAKQSELSF